MTQNTPNNLEELIEEFDARFVRRFKCGCEMGEHAHNVEEDPKTLKSFLKSALTQAKELGAREERERLIEWLRENAMPKNAGWEEDQRTLKLGDIITHIKEQDDE